MIVAQCSTFLLIIGMIMWQIYIRKIMQREKFQFTKRNNKSRIVEFTIFKSFDRLQYLIICKCSN